MVECVVSNEGLHVLSTDFAFATTILTRGLLIFFRSITLVVVCIGEIS